MFRVILINYCIFQIVEQSPSWEGDDHLVKFSAFMETEDNYYPLDNPTTGPYPESVESSPCSCTPFLYDLFNTILQSTPTSL
jgi:hypothetical protein